MSEPTWPRRSEAEIRMIDAERALARERGMARFRVGGSQEDALEDHQSKRTYLGRYSFTPASKCLFDTWNKKYISPAESIKVLREDGDRLRADRERVQDRDLGSFVDAREAEEELEDERRRHAKTCQLLDQTYKDRAYWMERCGRQQEEANAMMERWILKEEHDKIVRELQDELTDLHASMWSNEDHEVAIQRERELIRTELVDRMYHAGSGCLLVGVLCSVYTALLPLSTKHLELGLLHGVSTTIAFLALGYALFRYAWRVEEK